VLAAAWWENMYAAFEKALSSRAGMIQFGAIIMTLALVIIWWRR
jgi:hypothetical protein